MHGVSCEYKWVDAADATLDDESELVLPRDDKQFFVGDVNMGHAAVYRFVLRDETGTARWYVGQSGAVDARFGNYEGGAAREGTDQHVHTALKSHLEKGGSVSVQALVKPSLAVNGGEPTRTWKYGHRRIFSRQPRSWNHLRRSASPGRSTGRQQT